MHLGKLRHVTNCGVVQLQQSAVAQLQNRNRRKCLGNRGPVVGRGRIHRRMHSTTRLAVAEGPKHLPAVHQRKAAANNAVALHLLVKLSMEGSYRVLRKGVQRRSCQNGRVQQGWKPGDSHGPS